MHEKKDKDGNPCFAIKIYKDAFSVKALFDTVNNNDYTYIVAHGANLNPEGGGPTIQAADGSAYSTGLTAVAKQYGHSCKFYSCNQNEDGMPTINQDTGKLTELNGHCLRRESGREYHFS